jgi:hypothetical protein
MTFPHRLAAPSWFASVGRARVPLILAAIGLGAAAAQLSGKSAGAANGYAGDKACAECHRDQFAGHQQSSHALTSQLASPATVKGRFDNGANLLRTSNPNLLFVMESDGRRCTQTAMLRTSSSEQISRTEAFDIVIGSGRKGQTSLYWDGDLLCQLPVSWWGESNEWVNSPGYPDGAANFDRPIAPRCLECHASSFRSAAPPANRYDRASLVLGISCERCHGPSAAHVAQATRNPRAAATSVVNPHKLSRERQMDLCGLCHSGAGTAVTPPGTYTVGAKLADHVKLPEVAPNAPVDVHAGQIELLEQSRCFRESGTMTCTTCHDPHRNERDLVTLGGRCLTCHTVKNCRVAAVADPATARQCVTCHMPLQKTEQIVISRILGKELQPQVRNHRIAIYPAAK